MNQEQMHAAMESMVQWLSHPHELGRAPYKIECAGSFVHHEMCYYIFRFKKNILGRWLLGVCGGYEGCELEHCGHVFSDLEPYDPGTAERDSIAMVDSLRAYWMREAEKQSARQTPAAPQENPFEQTVTEETEPEQAAAGESVEESREEPAAEAAPAGTCLGFVLLSQPAWDKQQLMSDLAQDWDITVEERTPDSDALMFACGSSKVIVSMLPAPIPNGEAEEHAKMNYMWKEALEVTQSHKAHLAVAVLDKTADVRDYSTLLVKIMSSCCHQSNAVALYTGNTVMSPDHYQQAAQCIHSGQLPILNLVWFQLYRSQNGLCCCTNGMGLFGKDEMEVLDTDERPAKLRAFLLDIAAYLLKSDAVLKDGNTIGTSPEDKHRVTRSKGAALPGMTLKIDYNPL